MNINEKFRIKEVELNSRLVMAPMATEKSNAGEVTEEMIDYYVKRSCEGKLGLIIIEHSFIRPDGKASVNQLSVSKDSDIEGLAKLAERIHEAGSKVIMQINHAGSAIKAGVVDEEGVSPSGLINPISKNATIKPDGTHAMSKEEIDTLVDDFYKAAVRVKKAGFDGVEIHSAHSYLLNQFYSPLTNKRTDEYNGNTIEGRTLAHVKVLNRVKELADDNFIVGIRLGGSDYCEGGSTVEDAVNACRIFEEAGAEFVDLSGGMCSFTIVGRNYPGYFDDMSKAVKDAVNIPVIMAGGIKSKEDVIEVLNREVVDLISVGRAILQDEDFARKVID